MAESNKARFYGFDSLRVLMLFIVILVHVLQYTKYAGLLDDSLNNPVTKSFLDVTLLYLDLFPMGIFFFLSGYFAPHSLIKRGRYVFLRQKASRILLPCILGIVLVVLPLQYEQYIIHHAASNPGSAGIIDFTINYFFGSMYYQMHYWFLSTLFILFLVYGLVGRTNKDSDSDSKNSIMSNKFAVTASYVFTALVCFVTINFFADFYYWANVYYITLVRPAIAGSYITSFMLGIYACHHKWFMQGYRTHTGLYFILGLISSLLTILLFLFGKSGLNLSDDIYNFLFSCSCGGIAVFVTLFLLDLFSSFKNEPPAMIKSIANFSYGIYWWHNVIIILILRYIYEHKIEISATPLIIMMILLTFIFSYIIHFITSKIFKKLGF